MSEPAVLSLELHRGHGVTAGPGPAAETARPGPAGWNIRWALRVLVAVCALPGLLLSGYLVFDDYRTQKAMLLRESMAYTRAVAANLDRALASIEANLQVLATSPALVSGDPAELPAFYRRVREALPLQQNINNYVLIAPDGRQLLNTLRPWGAPLPMRGSPPQLQALFDEDRPVMMGLVNGPVAGKPLVGMAVPVRRGDDVIYALSVGIFPERILEIVKRIDLPDGWMAVIVDGAGTIVARTHEMDRFLGKKAASELVSRVLAEREGSFESVTLEGIAVTTTFVRSSVSPWTVAIGVPKEILEGELRHSFASVLGVTGLLVGVGLAVAWAIGSRIVDSIARLVPLAAAMGTGRTLHPGPMGLHETDVVAEAFRRASEDLRRAQYEAHHDNLTGLANRALLTLLIEKQAVSSLRTNSSFCVLCLDLDGFKAVNDTHGHPAGDLLLKEVAARLTAAVRASDIPARLGGDEFVVMLADCTLDTARAIAQGVLDSLRRPYGIENAVLHVTASIGIAAYPETTLDHAALLEAADRALYAAKRSGRDRIALAGPDTGASDP